MPRVRGFILLSWAQGSMTMVAISDTTSSSGCSSSGGSISTTVSASISWTKGETFFGVWKNTL